MEVVTPLNLIAHGLKDESSLNRAMRLGELDKLCGQYDGDIYTACRTEIVRAAMEKFYNSPESVFGFCSKSKTAQSSNECKLNSVDIYNVASNFNLTLVKNICRGGFRENKSIEGKCYDLIATGYLNVLAEKKAGALVKFCSSLEDTFRISCFKTMKQKLVNEFKLRTGTMAELCRNILDKQIKSECEAN